MPEEIVKASISKSEAIRHSCSTIERCCMTLPRSDTLGRPCCVFLKKVNPLRIPPPCPKREHDKHCDGLTNLETQGLVHHSRKKQEAGGDFQHRRGPRLGTPQTHRDTAADCARAENDERLVAARSRSTDSSRLNALLNSAGVDP